MSSSRKKWKQQKETADLRKGDKTISFVKLGIHPDVWILYDNFFEEETSGRKKMFSLFKKEDTKDLKLLSPLITRPKMDLLWGHEIDTSTSPPATFTP